MKRVVVVGPGAAGKSTLAARLGEITRRPVIELDKLFWQPSLAPRPQEEWVAIQRRLVAQESWIMDGELGPCDVIDVRLHAADAIVFLDFSPFRCAWRAIRRSPERAEPESPGGDEFGAAEQSQLTMERHRVPAGPRETTLLHPDTAYGIAAGQEKARLARQPRSLRPALRSVPAAAAVEGRFPGCCQGGYCCGCGRPDLHAGGRPCQRSTSRSLRHCDGCAAQGREQREW